MFPGPGNHGELNLWITPKIFEDLADPEPGVRAFFDHYADWITASSRLVLVFCAGNGDHVLNYRGRTGWGETFDWARYNCFVGNDASAAAHNRNWLTRVREGGERSDNPYSAGPSFLLSDQPLDYSTLANIYHSIRAQAAVRGVELVLLEYLEPGPEFCESDWKTTLHPEGARGTADAGGNISAGVIDVCSVLVADSSAYAAYPEGFAAGESTGEFVARQSAAFVRDFNLDGIYLGNQFGLLGFWHPDNAPEPTAERRAGISRFFRRLREEFGDKLIYWMDTYWPTDVERDAWAMDPANYYYLDAIMVSTFAVLVEPTRIEPNVLSRAALGEHPGAPRVIYSLDFVDPWYWYRVYLDDRRNYLNQRAVYRRVAQHVDGVAFFANDTFGQFVVEGPLGETLELVRLAG